MKNGCMKNRARLSLKKSKEQFEQDARFLLAVKLYELEQMQAIKHDCRKVDVDEW